MADGVAEGVVFVGGFHGTAAGHAIHDGGDVAISIVGHAVVCLQGVAAAEVLHEKQAADAACAGVAGQVRAPDEELRIRPIQLGDAIPPVPDVFDGFLERPAAWGIPVIVDVCALLDAAAEVVVIEGHAHAGRAGIGDAGGAAGADFPQPVVLCPCVGPAAVRS